MTTTLDEVWDLFKQVSQSQHETDLQLQETDRLMREQSQESDLPFQLLFRLKFRKKLPRQQKRLRK